MKKKRKIFRFLMELAYVTFHKSIASGVNSFTIDMSVLDYDCEPRPGFTTRDEVEAFCWQSGCTYLATRHSVYLALTFRLPQSRWRWA